MDKKELIVCANNFNYFASKYLKITHPKHGLIPFSLYDYQDRFIKHIENNKFSVVKKFRQGGFTDLMAGYMLWKSMFGLDNKILFTATRDSAAINCGNRLEVMVEQLPDWLKPEFGKRNDHTKEFTETNSIISFLSCQGACSKYFNLLIIDEAAWVDDMDAHWRSLYPVISSGTKCIVISTPNRKKNWFCKLWTKAKKGANTFVPFDVDFREHPDYNNAEWMETTKRNLGAKFWSQEVEAEFLD